MKLTLTDLDTQTHVPVLTNKVLQYLAPTEGGVYIDCTLGTGGHTRLVAEKVGPQGKVYGVETDERNLTLAREQLQDLKNVHFVHNSFKNLEEIGQEIQKKERGVDGILFDLGLSSLHVDDPTRGFSFQKDGPLDMRFNPQDQYTAAQIVNSYSLPDLIAVFKTYGEEPYANQIAKAITEHRRKNPFHRTKQLADFVVSLIPGKSFFKRHPATRIFQALRIATNDELAVLAKGVTAAIELLSPGGRLVVISYHSLEDRIVKNLFRESARTGTLALLTKKPIRPDESEKQQNPRSRSALLRAAEKGTVLLTN